jgi:small-conductance mechanosensitive channel
MGEFQGFLAGLDDAGRALAEHVNSVWLWIQLALIVLAGVVAAGMAALIRARTDLVSLTMGWPPFLRLLARAFAANLGLVLFLAIAGIIRIAMLALTWPSRSYLLAVAVNLVSAWVVIALVAGLIRNRFVYRLVVVTAWTIAALSILGLLDPTAEALNSVAIVIGGLRISLLLVFKLIVFLLLTVWLAIVVSNFVEQRLRQTSDLTPSVQVLLSKLVRLALITFAILLVVGAAGIDLSALAFFSGAVGIGIGFGLQKIVSNLVSGIILLADKSIKPGDVVTVGQNFGWVNAMGTRYTSVVTRDGREFLVPNEEFVTKEVINWSYSDNKIRLDIAFGVSYDSDPHAVRRLAVETASAMPRVLKDPPPVCHLADFGESSLDFVLRFWIDDPIEGITNVRGAVLLALWDAFKREKIEIPFPQRDLRLRAPARLVVESESPNSAGAKPE